MVSRHEEMFISVMTQKVYNECMRKAKLKSKLMAFPDYQTHHHPESRTRKSLNKFTIGSRPTHQTVTTSNLTTPRPNGALHIRSRLPTTSIFRTTRSLRETPSTISPQWTQDGLFAAIPRSVRHLGRNLVLKQCATSFSVAAERLHDTARHLQNNL